MGKDYLRGVLASCRVTGMLARLDLGAQYGNTPVLLGTAVDLRAWEGIGSAATRHGRPPERGRPRGQEAERRTMACWHCGDRHHVRDCEDVSETMRARLLALHRNRGIRRNKRRDPGGGAAAESARLPFGDRSMSKSPGKERKGEDGNQRLASGRRAAAGRKDLKCYLCSGPHRQRHCTRRREGPGPSGGVAGNRDESTAESERRSELRQRMMDLAVETEVTRQRLDEEAGAAGAPPQQRQLYRLRPGGTGTDSRWTLRQLQGRRNE
jgi:hypothetical protein